MTVEISDARKRRAIDFLLANEGRLPDVRVVSQHTAPFRGVSVEVEEDDLEALTSALEDADFDFEVSD